MLVFLFPVIVTIALAVLLYKLLFSNRYKNFWTKYGVPEIDISSVISNTDLLLGRKSLFDVDAYVYKKLGQNGKYCGVILQGRPVLFVKDIEILKKILIKDFDYFMDRRQFFNESDGCLKNILFNMQSDKWKGVRLSVSPTFTAGKVRRMMDCFNQVGKEWVGELSKRAKESLNCSLKFDVMTNVNKFTVNTIASTVFGLNAGLVKNPDSDFMKMANRLVNMSTLQIIVFAIRFQFPELSRALGLKMVDTEAFEYFERILTQGLKRRLSGETKRNDFLQLLVEAKSGKLKAYGPDELSVFEKDAHINAEKTIGNDNLTEDVMIALCVNFFFAGFSTTSTLISFVLYVLAEHQDVQEKLRKEIESIAKDDEFFDYDDLEKLVYMDMVVSEVNRKYPPAGRYERICVKDFKDTESGLVVPKGTAVAIPMIGFHQDQQYYSNANSFDPNHFSPENKAARNPYAYMPFGIGPRNCIGRKFAIVESKVAVAHFVRNFKIKVTEKTPLPPKMKPVGIQILPPDGLELLLTPIR